MDVTPVAGGAQLGMSHHRVSFSIGLQNSLRAKGDAKATALAPVREDGHMAPGQPAFGAGLFLLRNFYNVQFTHSFA